MKVEVKEFTTLQILWLIVARYLRISVPCPHDYMKRWTFETDHIPKVFKWIFPTVHYCDEFDGLVIDEYCKEWEYCSCIKKDKLNGC